MKQKYFLVIILLLIVSASLFLIQHVLAQGGAIGPGGIIEPCPGETGKMRDASGNCVCPSGQEEVSGKCQLLNPAPGQLVDERDFGKLLIKIVNIMLMFAGGIAVIFLMIGGFQYVMSRGNEEAMEKAKRTLTTAIGGIVVIIMAWALVNMINTLLTKSAEEQYIKSNSAQTK